MKFYGVDDGNTVKVKSVALLSGQDIGFEKVGKTLKKGLSPTGRLPVLYNEQGELIAFSANAIVRLLTPSDSPLLGGKDWAQVEQWMEYAQCDLDGLALAATQAEKLAKKDQASVLEKAAHDALITELDIVEKHLATRTFLVGEALTLADIAVACSLLKPLTELIEPKVRGAKLTNVSRWFETVSAQAKFDQCADKPVKLYVGKKKAANAGKTGMASSSKASGTVAHVPLSTPSSSTKIKALFKRSRVRIKDILYLPGQGEELIGQQVVVCGWARTIREQAKGTLAFIELNDGSCYEGMQVVCSVNETEGFEQVTSCGGTGTSHQIFATVVESPGKGQKVELKANKVVVLGTVDQNEYPLKKTGKSAKGHSVEFLREIAHLRPRTHLFGAVARVRNACAHAVHQFFNERGFLYVHTPLITASDCEGAGEMFAVTTLLGKAEENKGQLPVVDEAAAKARANEPIPPKVGSVDYKQDFFGRPAFLTVSGQLNVETYACALSDVYTFGPTFRAENSNTSRHLAEFWMIEPELCFADLNDDMNLAEDFLKYVTQYVMDHCPSDLDFFDKRVEPGLVERLKNVLDNPFQRLTYTEAIEILNKPENLKAGNFEEKPEWGIDLGSEHERFLAEQVYKKPVILTNYPADIKAFYMRQNDLDSQGRLTVQAMDILVPRIGEVIGGSVREERLDKLEERIKAMNLKPEDFDWYCDLRRYGSVPHAGFGLGFERLIMFITGVQNIRDVIPFPRYPNHCSY